ncbi:hypothetical protein OG909_05735 [Streptomyces sp. NBC_01754]|uniref:hypothetical protein n=1 Tax=Streptomyces sp. NBC_01754 TaxID=2975930 RepID=UPI002DD9F0FC|nr:hypothetical protein [Streptomyces sp. NBC_01754]WSC91829.1 hypothetical protein OG909_05735 [Streptomyces sp. NBC_01754]
MPGFAKKDPLYLDRPEYLDGVFNAVMELASELWVLRDRFSLLEEILDEKGVVVREDLETRPPGPEAAARLAADRLRFAERLLEGFAASPPPPPSPGVPR